MDNKSLSITGTSSFTGPHPKRNPGQRTLSRLELEASIPPPLRPEDRPPSLPSKEASTEELQRFHQLPTDPRLAKLDPNYFGRTPKELKELRRFRKRKRRRYGRKIQ